MNHQEHTQGDNLKERLASLRSELTLTHAERAAMRAELAKLSAPAVTALSVRPTPSPFFTLFAHSRFALAALVLVVLGGSVSFAAEGALPGDVLYPIKVSVNERVERAAALSPVAKANVEIQHAEERLREVQLLAAEDEEDRRDLDEVTEEVRERVSRASETVADLREQGEEEEADRIENAIAFALSAQADILEAQAEGEDEEGRRRLRALSVAVSITADDAKNDEGEDAHITDEAAAELVLAREERVRTRIESLRNEVEDDGVTDETKEELLAEIAEIEAEFGQARALIAEGSYDEAGSEYEDVEERAYRAEALFMSARRITDKTGKSVFIRFDGRKAKEAATSIMLMTAPEEDGTKEREAPELEFRIEEREDR